MPQKKNPCGLELVRAKSATVISNLMNTIMIIRALPSGYHRDFQETKQALMAGLETTLNSLRICNLSITKIIINEAACIKAFSRELFATDYALSLVQKGQPFREAYKQVALNPDAVPLENPIENINKKQHLGATGNLGLELSHQQCTNIIKWVNHEQTHYQQAIHNLLEEK